MVLGGAFSESVCVCVRYIDVRPATHIIASVCLINMYAHNVHYIHVSVQTYAYNIYMRTCAMPFCVVLRNSAACVVKRVHGLIDRMTIALLPLLEYLCVVCAQNAYCFYNAILGPRILHEYICNLSR